MATELFSRFAQGDTDAYQALREELFPRVLALCEKLLGRGHTAQETAEDLWTDFLVNRAQGLRQEHAVHAYLRIATIRRCRRLLEVQGRHQELVVEVPLAEDGAEQTLISRDEARVRHERLEDCLGRLQPRARQMLRMRYHLGLTQESIGQTLGFTKQYAGRVLAKSLDGLRRCLEAS